MSVGQRQLDFRETDLQSQVESAHADLRSSIAISRRLAEETQRLLDHLRKLDEDPADRRSHTQQKVAHTAARELGPASRSTSAVAFATVDVAHVGSIATGRACDTGLWR